MLSPALVTDPNRIPGTVLAALPWRSRLWLAWMKWAPRLGSRVPGGSALFRLLHGRRRVSEPGDSLVALEAAALPRLLVVDPTDYEVYQHTIPLWLHGSPEHDLIRRHLRPGALFVDVGANYGVYSLFAASLRLDGAQVLAIEPQPTQAEAIRRSAMRNRLTNIEVVEALAGESEGEATLFVPESGSGSASQSERYAARGSRVTMLRRPRLRIDDLLANRRTQRLDLLKVDVEGYETDVILGARQAITRFRPLISFEVNLLALSCRGDAPEGAASVLREMGYRRFVELASGRPLDMSRVAGSALLNVVALPGTEELA